MKSLFLSAQLFILFLLFASCSNPSNYGTTNLENRMFRGSPMHNGVSSARSFLNVDIKWKFRTDGAIRGSASMNTSTLFIGSGDGHLYAVDKVLGKEYWKFKIEGAVYSTPALYKGLVIFTSRDNHLYAVSQSDGELIWKVKMNGMPAHKWGWDYFQSSPTTVDDQIVIGSDDGTVYNVDAATGTVNWNFKTNGRLRATPAVQGGIVYIGSFDGFLYALDNNTGVLKWKFETDGTHLNSDESGWDRISIDSSPAIADSVLVFGSRDGNVYALNTLTGKQYWKFSYGPTWAISSPAIRKGVVYIGWSDNNLFSAIDLATGREQWQFVAKNYVYSSPLVSDSIVYVGSHDQNLYALNTQTGSKVWQYRTGGGVLSSPIIDGELLYIGSDDGNLYAFERSSKPTIRKAMFAQHTAPKYFPVDSRAGSYFNMLGYESLDTLAIEKFVTEQIASKKPSVLVFVTDRIPTSLLTTTAGEEFGLLRRYLNTGGRVVWMGAIPNLFKIDGQGNVIGESAAEAENLLDVKFDVTHDLGGYFCSVTDEGTKWGLERGWVGSFSVKQQDGISVLAVNDHNRPSAWFKNFGDSLNSGFVYFRPWEVGKRATDEELEMVRTIAEKEL